MSSESEHPSETPADPEEKQLCINCMLPNGLSAHFCAKCGAPLTSYAATGPFEHLFAEGHVYRQATERPQRFIVVLGIWLIFGMLTLAGLALVALGREADLFQVVIGALFVAISLVMIVKTTRNYFRKGRGDKKSQNS